MRDRGPPIDLPGWQDSLTGRYFGPVRVYLEGNRRVAVGLIKEGLTQLGGMRHSLALGSLSCGARRVRLPDGATIESRWDGTINILRLFAPDTPDDGGFADLFMESGFLDLRPVFPIGGLDRAAAKVYFAEPQLERAGKSPTLLDWLLFSSGTIDLKLEGHKTRELDQGIDSLSVGAADVEHSTAEKRDWLVPSWHGYHPINRTGKLKLLLQSVMGRDQVLDPVCALGPLRGLDTASSTLGLFSYDTTDHAPAYAVLHISSTTDATTISACPLEFDVRVAAALRVLPEADRELAESYWLATTSASGSQPAVVVATLPGIVGTPFAYGWKFNRKGNRVAIVTAERVYSTNGTHIVHHLMRRYSIEIEEEGNRTFELGYGLKAKLSLAEGPVACTPRTNGDLLWYPSVMPPGISMLRCVYWEDRPLHYQNGPTVLCDEVPIYCFYNEKDELVVVRFFTERAEPLDTEFEWLTGCGTVRITNTALYKSSERYNAGFYLTDEVDKVHGNQTGSWVFQDITAFETHNGLTSCYANWYYLGCNQQPYPAPAPDCGMSGPPYTGWRHHLVMGRSIRRRKQWIEASGSETILIIPFGNAESCYLGSLEQKVQTVAKDQIDVLSVVTRVVGPGAIDLPILHQEQGGTITFYVSYDAVYQRALFVLLAQHGSYPVADKIVESGKEVDLVENPVWRDVGNPDDEMPSEFGNLFNPVLFGIDAYPWHRPMTVYESDRGLVAYERLHEEANVMVFVANDGVLPHTEWFSTFVGWA